MAKQEQFVFDERSAIRCPTCKSPLRPVTQDGAAMLNQDQFDAVKAGDYLCETCPDNGRGKSGLRYFWKSELGVTV